MYQGQLWSCYIDRGVPHNLSTDVTAVLQMVDHVDRDHVHVRGDVVEGGVAEAREQDLLVDLAAEVVHVVALEVIPVVDLVAVQGGIETGREADGEEVHLGQ